MKPPLFIRPLSEDEQQRLKDALHTTDAFPLRRAQYLLASARGQKPKEIATTYGGCEQTVRNVLHAFAQRGLDCLQPKSRRPKHPAAKLTGAPLERLQHILHQSPRTFGKNQSLWTQRLLAEVAYEEELTDVQVSQETIRQALARLQANWKRAKHWITSPDPQYAVKKSGGNGCCASPSCTRNGC